MDPREIALYSSLFHLPAGCKLFNAMRYFFDNYLAYITVCLPKVKGFESACEALSMISERERQCRHYVRYL
jgi:hypothetical protein